MSERTDWDRDFPDVILFAEDGALKKFEHYLKAKSGDYYSAFDIVRQVVSMSKVAQLHHYIRDNLERTIIVPVVSIEETGANRLPGAFANLLGAIFRLDIDYDVVRHGVRVDSEIVHINTVNRGKAGGFHRLVCHPIFEGEVLKDHDYVIVDDTITQGGTLVSLKGYIESRGGRVVCSCTLTGQERSARLAPHSQTVEDLRDKYPELEIFFQKEFGYGFEKLTESEASYLLKVKPQDAESIRNKLVTAREQAGC